MPLEVKISAKDYYETLPAGTHSTGDIWRDLPTFGLLGKNTTTGVVITPACDLAHKKCETITYLPIVDLSEYIGSSAFYSETWNALQEILAKLKLEGFVIPPDRFELPIKKEVEESISRARHLQNTDDGKRLLIGRLESYYKYMQCIFDNKNPSANLIEQIISRTKFDKILSSMVKNGFKPDIHFLPAVNNPSSYSAIPENSVVLFRYPLTVPVLMLSEAQFCEESNWFGVKENLDDKLPIAKHFPKWPVKLSRLRNDFLSDLLSRYLGMYIRMGSRDFTEDDVTSIVKNIKESK
jgi:hypothetical protein